MGSRLDTAVTIVIVINVILFLWEWVPTLYYIREFSHENFHDAMWLLVHVLLLTGFQASFYMLKTSRTLRPVSDFDDHHQLFRRRRTISKSRSEPPNEV
jgi:hypothetical protein